MQREGGVTLSIASNGGEVDWVERITGERRQSMLTASSKAQMPATYPSNHPPSAGD
jgi:hypothetical protein